MEKNEIVERLTQAGLNKYQAKAYTYLLSVGSASAVAISRGSDIPKSRIYDTLEDLERKGYVETYEQDSLHARVLNPDEVLEDLREQAKSLTEVADAVEDLWEEPSVDEYQVTLVKRHETVSERAKEFIRSAENEMQVAATPEQFYELRPMLLEAFSRGVFIKLVITLPEGASVDSAENLDFEGVATEVRLRDLEAPFLVLVDRTKTCFSPQRSAGGNFGLIADNSTLTYIFHWYFQTSLWDVWEIIHTTHNNDPPIEYVNIRQCVLDIAPLLAEGADITVTVEGETTDTEDDVTITGVITDVDFTGSFRNPVYPSLTEVAGQVTLYVDDGERVRTVGGRFAKIEEVSMHRLTVERIDFDDDA